MSDEAIEFDPVFSERGAITAEQYEVLMRPLRATRVATRRQGGKELSYLEAWDVRAHLIRVFGFGNFDANVVRTQLMFERDVEVGSNKNPGIEVAYLVEFCLRVRDRHGMEIAVYTEAAVGSATGSVNFGDLHDNALKTAASDALKRCAINLGTQFGLSLYDDGRKDDVVKTTLVHPGPFTPQEGTGDDLTPEQREVLERSLGAVPAPESPSDVPERDIREEVAQ